MIDTITFNPTYKDMGKPGGLLKKWSAPPRPTRTGSVRHHPDTQDRVRRPLNDESDCISRCPVRQIDSLTENDRSPDQIIN